MDLPVHLPVVQHSAFLDEEKLLACIHCGFCLPTCPTHVLTGLEMPSPRGRLYLMRAVHEGRLSIEDPVVAEHEESCLVCRSCETACPSGVEFGYLMEQMRAELRRVNPPSRLERLIYRNILPSRPALMLLQLLAALGSSRFLAPIVRRFGGLINRQNPQLGAMLALMPDRVPFPSVRMNRYYAVGPKRGEVALLLGCVGESMASSTNDATIRVFTRLGYDVRVLHDAVCCGALQIHAGFRNTALELAVKMMTSVAGARQPFFVTNIAGCGAMLKDYKGLFANTEHEALANDFTPRVRDISEFLFENALDELQSATASHSPPVRVAYQAACHLYHGQRIQDLPMQLLSAIPGLTVTALRENELCCGSAGTYNLEHPVEADALLRRKLEAIDANGAEVIVTSNPGCLMQLRKGIRESGREVRVMHVIELIDEIIQSTGSRRTARKFDT